MAELRGSGLLEDEAFLIPVRRLGSIDDASRAFARERYALLSEQPAGTSATGHGGPGFQARAEAFVVLALAVGAGTVVKIPVLFGIGPGEANALFYARNGPLVNLPFLVDYLAWQRGIALRSGVWHLPIAVWLMLAVAYTGGRWSVPGVRMDFVRYCGELAIRYGLIAMGGGVLPGWAQPPGLLLDRDRRRALRRGVADPCATAGAVLVGSWLVGEREGMIENVAPVLARAFTPLFATALLTSLGAMAWMGRPIEVQREVLIAFDLLLVVVVGLLLYDTSARDLRGLPGSFDVLQLVLCASALLMDALALGAIKSRITGFGFTPNRVAAPGENLLLLVHVAWSTHLYACFLRSGTGSAAVERWQVSYLPVYSACAALVIIAFPLADYTPDGEPHPEGELSAGSSPPAGSGNASAVHGSIGGRTHTGARGRRRCDLRMCQTAARPSRQPIFFPSAYERPR